VDTPTFLADLLARGFTLALHPAGIRVMPASRLTDGDRATIRAHKPKRLALLAAASERREGTIAAAPSWDVVEADALTWLNSLPADSADLMFASPPYEAARTYGIGFALRGQEWCDRMAAIVKAALRVCRGLVAFVVQGQTRPFRWSATPALLMADLHRAGVPLRNPPIFHRVGIPGSGGPDWLRRGYEWIVCATRGGKLPRSNNTAMGHKPKWAPGGEMSNRKASGARVNDYGYATGGHTNGDTSNGQGHNPPPLANPGNVIRATVGGGLTGSPLAHGNEAPFPVALAELFIKSFAPPGGLVLDCFSGGGTTGAVAVRHGRRFAGCDIRPTQVELSRHRIVEEIATPSAKADAEPPQPEE
jgi:hypothetical protein